MTSDNSDYSEKCFIEYVYTTFITICLHSSVKWKVSTIDESNKFKNLRVELLLDTNYLDTY